MSASIARLARLLLLLAIPLVAPASVAAASPDEPEAVIHVRPLTKGLDERIADGASRAPTFAGLLARLHTSDVVAYVACGLKDRFRFGQLQFITTCGDVRYVLIEMRCDLHPEVLVAAIAHELQHAVEIADAPSVVDVATLRRLYLEIGRDVTGEASRFDTRAAIQAGTAVRRELDEWGKSAVAP